MRTNIYNMSERVVSVLVGGYIRRVDPKSSLSVTEKEAKVMLEAFPKELTIDYKEATGKPIFFRLEEKRLARLDKMSPGQLVGVVRLHGPEELDLPETELKQLKRDELQSLAGQICRGENVDSQSVLRLIEERKKPAEVKAE
jgi:hypothetical protein